MPKPNGCGFLSRMSTAFSSPVPHCLHGPGPRIKYQDPNGVERTWESAERQTRPNGCDIDGVGIMAILEKPTGVLITSPYMKTCGAASDKPRHRRPRDCAPEAVPSTHGQGRHRGPCWPDRRGRDTRGMRHPRAARGDWIHRQGDYDVSRHV